MLSFSRFNTVCPSLFAALALAACGGSTSNPGIGAQDSGVTVDGGAGDDDASVGDDEASAADAAASDGSSGTDGAFVTAAHRPQPQVVKLNGSVIASPKVQLIVYTEDTNAVDDDAMITELTQTTTWAEQTSEYGVGPFTKLQTISITGTPPGTLDDNGSPSTFQQTLVANTTGANPIWGAADPNTIYAFVLPYGTNIDSGGSCCNDFYGYHYQAEVSASTSIPYAIICSCNSPSGDPLTQLENVTTTINHELDEAATDPFPNSRPAYYQSDDNDIVWSDATGGEIGDMCEFNSDSNYKPPGSTYMVQRTWSNAAAAAGTNPCVPVPDPALYFDAMPVLPDTVRLYGTTSQGVRIPVGSSGTVDVQLFSTAPSAPWTVTAYDLNGYLGNTPNTTVSLDKTTGSNGDVLHLTIHVTSADPDLGGEAFVLVSDLNGQENMSFGGVGN